MKPRPAPRQAPDRSWATAALDTAARDALFSGLTLSALGSLLLAVAEQRAAARSPGAVMEQWRQDRLVAPATVDQRTLNALDAQLLAASAAFEAVELSPLAPLANCSAVAPVSQNKIVSTVRGSEVVADPTNVLALMCAERLRSDAAASVRLATSHRCLRTQPHPRRPGFAAHFRLFCLASAARERADRAATVDALVEHIATHLNALERLAGQGYAFGRPHLKLLATPACGALVDRIAVAVRTSHSDAMLTLTQGSLGQAYYHGLRFTIEVQTQGGEPLLLIDGGAFDWLQRLGANRKRVFVASAFGSQIAAHCFAPR